MAQWDLGWGFLAVFALIGVEAGVRGILFRPRQAQDVCEGADAMQPPSAFRFDTGHLVRKQTARHLQPRAHSF